MSYKINTAVFYMDQRGNVLKLRVVFIMYTNRVYDLFELNLYHMMI